MEIGNPIFWAKLNTSREIKKKLMKRIVTLESIKIKLYKAFNLKFKY